MEEHHPVKMIERVTVAKFDKTLEDNPTEPVQVITQETITEISEMEAMLLGWQPRAVEATGTVEVASDESAGTQTGD